MIINLTEKSSFFRQINSSKLTVWKITLICYNAEKNSVKTHNKNLQNQGAFLGYLH